MMTYEMGVLLSMMSFFCMLYNKSHILMLLLYFEMLFLGGYLMIKGMMLFMGVAEGMLIIYLMMGVVEGVMGLGLLIYLLRASGKDYYLMFGLTN